MLSLPGAHHGPRFGFLWGLILLAAVLTENQIAPAIHGQAKLAAIQDLGLIEDWVVLPFVGHPITKIYTGVYII